MLLHLPAGHLRDSLGSVVVYCVALLVAKIYCQILLGDMKANLITCIVIAHLFRSLGAILRMIC